MTACLQQQPTALRWLPQLGCTTECRWSIDILELLLTPPPLTPQAPAILIGQQRSVIIIKLWGLMSVLSVPETSSWDRTNSVNLERRIRYSPVISFNNSLKWMSERISMFPNYKNAWNAQLHTRQETAEVRVKKKRKKQKCVWFSWYICIFWSNDLENEERASELKHCVTRAVVFLYWSLAWINNPKTNTAPSSKSSLDITRRCKERTMRRGGFIFFNLVWMAKEPKGFLTTHQIQHHGEMQRLD